MTHIFISHASENIEFCRHLQSLLEHEGFVVWIDEKRIQPGVNWWDEIERNIDTCAAFLIVMSPESRNSFFVTNEILRAVNKQRHIYPILLSGDPFSLLASLHYEDMSKGVQSYLSPLFVERLRETVPLKTQPKQDIGDIELDTVIKNAFVDAERLLKQEQKSEYDFVPVAVMLGSVLEGAFRKLCERNGISLFRENSSPKMISHMLDDLRKRKVINELNTRQIQLWLSIRNAAAHGEFTQFNRQDVEQMLVGVKQFLIVYF